MKPLISTGTYTGTGAALALTLGFVPDYLRVINITDGTESFEWFSGMTAANVFKNANHDTAQNAVVTSNGVTALTDSTTGEGVTLGTALSTSAKVYRYVAMRNG